MVHECLKWKEMRTGLWGCKAGRHSPAERCGLYNGTLSISSEWTVTLCFLLLSPASPSSLVLVLVLVLLRARFSFILYQDNNCTWAYEPLHLMMSIEWRGRTNAWTEKADNGLWVNVMAPWSAESGGATVGHDQWNGVPQQPVTKHSSGRSANFRGAQALSVPRYQPEGSLSGGAPALSPPCPPVRCLWMAHFSISVSPRRGCFKPEAVMIISGVTNTIQRKWEVSINLLLGLTFEHLPSKATFAPEPQFLKAIAFLKYEIQLMKGYRWQQKRTRCRHK